MKKLFETPSVKVVRFNRSVVMGESTITNEEVVENALGVPAEGTTTQSGFSLGVTKVTVVL